MSANLGAKHIFIQRMMREMNDERKGYPHLISMHGEFSKLKHGNTPDRLKVTTLFT
jgi:hypothetical protein